MKDWKKAVLGSAIAFCLILAILGIFSLVGVVQMTVLKIRVRNVGEFVDETFQREIQIASFCALALCVVCVITLVFCAVGLFWSENTRLSIKRAAMVCTIVIAVVSVAFIITALCLRNKIPPYNDSYPDSIEYNDFLYHQSLLSAVFSSFVPLLIGVVLLLGYLFCKSKKHEEVTAVHTED